MPKTEEAKTLLIFTGGTIGATLSDNSNIEIDANNSKLLSLYQERYGKLPPLSISNPYTILSENLDTHHLQLLIDTIEEALSQGDLKGIIITHGSDTLAFTSNLLALRFFHLNIPIFLVCSDKVLSDKEANGLLHLHVAFSYIQQDLDAGIFIPYKNRGEACYIHRGDELMQSFQLSSRFESIKNQPAFIYKDEEIIPLHVKVKEPIKYRYSQKLHSAPIIIHPYPGIDYSTIALPKGATILHTTYHSGTLSDTIEILLERAKENRVTILFCGIAKSKNYYSTTAKLITSGAKILYNDSVESAYAKVLLGLF